MIAIVVRKERMSVVAEVRETGVVVGIRSREWIDGLSNGLLGDRGVRYCMNR